MASPIAVSTARSPKAGSAPQSRSDRVEPAHVLHGLDGYGLCEFTAEALLGEVARLRTSTENDFDETVTIKFEPSSTPMKGHAHCDIEPMPAIIQKALYRRLAKMTDGYLPGPAVAGRRADEDVPRQ